MNMSFAWQYILHADLDAFYTSLEQRDDHRLLGKPVVVGGAPEHRGVVAAASYEARKYGIHSAMPMSVAVRHCPDLVRVSPRFDQYRAASGQVMEIFRSVTSLVEPLSLDEAYLDISRVVGAEMANVEREASLLKRKVRAELGLAVTVGGGTSKTVAKIASQVVKPDGLLLVKPGEERGFLAPLDVNLLWGIGPKTAETLAKHGIKMIGDFVARDEKWIAAILGKRGPELRASGLGLDTRKVTPHQETKSVSAETTLPQDVEEEELLIQELSILAKNVAERLDREDLRGRTIQVKLRLADFTTFTRQMTLASPVSSEAMIFEVARILVSREIKPGHRFRLVGVGVSNFQRIVQPALL